MKHIILALLTTTALFGQVASAEPSQTCSADSDGPYCTYRGTVTKVYMIDSTNKILVYVSPNIDLLALQSAGITGVTAGNRFAYSYEDNPAFSDKLYASMLGAMLSGKEVTVQLRKKVSATASPDRFWVNYD